MQAGKRDRRIIIERFSETVDEWNQPVQGWASVGKRWASKQDVSDGEKLRAAQVGATISSRFQVRYDSLTKTITGADRLICDGKDYAIVGTKELGRREGIEITATTGNDNLVVTAPDPAP